MIIEQLVDIPADHKLTIEVPREVPAGRVVLTFMPAHDEERGTAEQPAKSATPITDRLAGCAAHLGDITLEQIREERLRKNFEGQPTKSATPHLDALSGCAAHLGDITLEQIREERLRKYL